MIGYVTLGTNDFERALQFYDQLFAVLGAGRGMESERYVGYSSGKGPAFLVIKPFDGKPASAGNGTMVALAAGDAAQVQAVHRRALELGAVDEGQPGPRGTSGFYGAYFRDLDGNKLAVFCMVKGGG
jgi:catechol 2,3-dioxygenase-like lactoylglutathione lyase family enzyme